jgi:apolipoprotein N-acyltransferase
MHDRLTSSGRLPGYALAGAASVFAFAPFGWWPLQIALLALLFRMALRTTSARQAGLLGWAYGFGWMTCGVYWLFISMHRYGGMPAWMAALAVVLMGLLLGAFYGAALGAARWIALRRRTGDLVALLLMSATWALSEWLRGWVFTGFPWLASGYAHTASPLAGYAPLAGVYGVGWLAAVAAACIALLPSRKLPLVAGAAIFAGGFALQSIAWTEPNGKPLSVRLLQGNVPQDLKFDRGQVFATLSMYRDLIHAAPADLIATPETALPLFLHQLPEDYLPQLAQYARQTGSHLMIGLPVTDGPPQYANSAIGIAPHDSENMRPYHYRYDKHHLVPFGEFIPPGFRWFVRMMQIPLGDFSRAPLLQPPFQVNDQWVQPNICYEDLFGEEIAAQLRASDAAGTPGATVLLNMSNIAWFGDTIAVPQHLQISQMRAIELGRPMLRATNTGATAVIDAYGNIKAQTPPFAPAVLAATVQGHRGATPYMRYGNAPVVTLLILLVAGALLILRKKPIPD